MLVKIPAGVTYGLNGILITVEVDIAQRGFPTCTIVGLPGKSVDEAKDRVKTAIINSGYDMPDSRITINLSPAHIQKNGPGFDLPIAVGILAASGVIDTECLKRSLFLGELSLQGDIHPVLGVLPIMQMAKNEGIHDVYVSSGNEREAVIVEGINVIGVTDLRTLILHLNNVKSLESQKKITEDMFVDECWEYDFSTIQGQETAKRAMEIAAAGFHGVLLKGPPGTGKTLLSKTFPSILPTMTKDEIIETTSIYSIAGLTISSQFVTKRPFRSPHHTVSRVGLIGGGSQPLPGEISLAHRGVLFLDEFPEFPRNVLESLRQPLEDGYVTISRAAGTIRFPSRFILIAAANPCPCGYYGSVKKHCICTLNAIMNYRKRISGPLLDRIDLHVDVPAIDEKKLCLTMPESETSKKIKERVMKAYEKQLFRFKKHPKIHTNSEMSNRDLKEYCRVSKEGLELLKNALIHLSISPRSYFRILKIGQTIADLEGCDEIKNHHIAESLQFRATFD